MKVKDFTGRTYNWPPPGYQPTFDETRPRSELHLRARALLYQMYPTQPILEEVPLPGINLFADFYLPLRKVVVEVNGEQHYKFVSHFHVDRVGFARSQKRDQCKLDWCHMNNIRVAALPYSENDDEWRERITKAND